MNPGDMVRIKPFFSTDIYGDEEIYNLFASPDWKANELEITGTLPASKHAIFLEQVSVTRNSTVYKIIELSKVISTTGGIGWIESHFIEPI